MNLLYVYAAVAKHEIHRSDLFHRWARPRLDSVLHLENGLFLKNS